MSQMSQKNFKLHSWNVNGIRAVFKKGFTEYLKKEQPDILGLQEIKANHEQIEELLTFPSQYECYWSPAEKKGYSGVGIISKIKPEEIVHGIGSKKFDSEGRVITAHFKAFSFLSCYFPNSQREHARLPYKLDFCKSFKKYCNKLLKDGKNLVICGDLNIAHEPIDLKNPKTNMNNAGFLPEERKWLSSFLKSGFQDTFRSAFPDLEEQYTWWSYRPGVREKNIGWRLDYFIVNEDFKDQTTEPKILSKVMGSDHCPVELRIKNM